MKTEDLINALAEDHAARPQPGSLRRTFFVAMALGLTLAGAFFFRDEKTQHYQAIEKK
jgi:hypothetical protein